MKLVRRKHELGRRRGNITGLCEGIGQYLGINPVWFRAAFVASTIFISTFWSILAYIGLVLLVPVESQTRSSRHKFYKTTSNAKPGITYVVCDNCNTAVKQGSRFCHRCGSKL